MPILIIICVVVVAAIAGGAATGLILSGAAFLILTRDRRAKRNLEFAEHKELERQKYYDELEARHARKAAITANAQANALAPYAALIAQALHGDRQPEPEPAYRMTAEVVKIGDKKVEPR
jgi:flagellar basal body-associated protein FliL